MPVDLHGHAPLGGVLPDDGAGKVLGREFGGLADGHSVAHLDELIGVVPVDQIRHDQIVFQHHQGLPGDDAGGQKCVCHCNFSPFSCLL